MKHTVSRELFSYWDALRKGRAAPERSDIDPAAIRASLADTFILAAEPDPSKLAFPIRLSGTRLNALFLQELKGSSMLGLWVHSDREVVARLVRAVFDDAAPLVAGVRGGPPDHRPIDLEMILLPLRHHGRTHARIMGAIAPITMPSWLGLMPLEGLTLTTLRVIDPAASDAHERRWHATPKPAPEVAGSPRRYGRFMVHQGGYTGADEPKIRRNTGEA